MGGPKIEKCEGGCVGVLDPYFWNGKIIEYDATKQFENWLRWLSVSKLNVSEYDFENGLSVVTQSPNAINT